MQALIDYASKISIFYNQHYSIFFQAMLKTMLVCENYATFSYSMLFKKENTKNPNFILIVDKARYLLYFELHTCFNQTQLITAVNSDQKR